MGFTSIDTQLIECRVEKLREKMKQDELDGILIFNDGLRPGYSLYISDYRSIGDLEGAAQAVFISYDKVVLFLDKWNRSQAQENTWIENIKDIEEVENFFKVFGKELKIGLTGIEKLPYILKKVVDRIGERVKFTQYDREFDKLKMIKNQDEIRLIKEASKHANKVIRRVSEEVEAGKTTEKDLAALGEFLIKRTGMDIGYDTIISSGLNTTEKTWRPSNKVVEDGEVLMINLVPQYRGYCSFTTMTYAVNNPFVKQVCEKAKKVIKRTISELKEGDSSKKIYELYHKYSKEYGVLDNFLPLKNSKKSIGHSTGIEVVEYPYLDSRSDVVLEKGMVFSLKYCLNGYDFGDITFEYNILIDEMVHMLNGELFEDN